MTLFGLPDFISGWRNASFMQKTVYRVLVVAGSFLAGFSFTGGTAWAGGAAGFVGFGVGLVGGAGCFILAARHMGFPIAFPQAAIDEVAKNIIIEEGKEK